MRAIVLGATLTANLGTGVNNLLRQGLDRDSKYLAFSELTAFAHHTTWRARAGHPSHRYKLQIRESSIIGTKKVISFFVSQLG